VSVVFTLNMLNQKRFASLYFHCKTAKSSFSQLFIFTVVCRRYELLCHQIPTLSWSQLGCIWLPIPLKQWQQNTTIIQWHILYFPNLNIDFSSTLFDIYSPVLWHHDVVEYIDN